MSAGLTAKERRDILLAAARQPTGQGMVVASWILGMYNGYENKVDLTDLRSLDHELKQALLQELCIDSLGGPEIHIRWGIGDKGIETIRRAQGIEVKDSERDSGIGY